MSYSLEFKESALKEWHKLDGGIREQFKKKLAERLQRPRVESARLSGMGWILETRPLIFSSYFPRNIIAQTGGALTFLVSGESPGCYDSPIRTII